MGYSKLYQRIPTTGIQFLNGLIKFVRCGGYVLVLMIHVILFYLNVVILKYIFSSSFIFPVGVWHLTENYIVFINFA